MLHFLKTNFRLALIFVLLSGFLPDVALAKQKVLYKGIITAFQLNIRTQPSRTSDVLVVLKKGQSVDVVSKKGPTGSWLTVMHQGRKGYIRNRAHYVKLYPVITKEKVAQKKEKPEKQTVQKKKVLKSLPKPVKPEIEQVVPKQETVAAPKKVEPVEEKKEKKESVDTTPKKTESVKIQEKIENQEKLVKEFTEKEREIIEGLNEIDYALNKARIRVKDLSVEVESLDKKVSRLSQDTETLKQDIDQNQEYAGQRLKALYKMNMIGRLDASGTPTTIFDFFLQQNAMKRVIETDLNVLERQNTDFEKLDTLKTSLEREMESKAALEIELNDQIRMNKKETLKKELILTDIRKKRRLSLAAVESLKEAQIRLDHKIDTLKQGKGSKKAPLSFSNYKGRLKLPVNGKIISTYGPSRSEDHKAFSFQKGIDIKVERGEPVKSVFRGEVMFAQWLKGYGNLLIIDHGDNYYTLYAHVEEIFKQKGESVEKGEVIATAGDTGSIKGMCLHFEVRHHGKPVNPIQWFRKGA